MSLTNITQIRNHLYRLDLGAGDVRNQPLRLYADAYTNLPHAHVTASSEVVKVLTVTIPISEAITLEEDPVSLGHPHLVPDTVVCASDSSLTTVYQENIDYLVDYAAGSILRVSDGSIPAASSVAVWYLYYHVYQRGVDYTIDYDRGRMRRISSGSVEEGQEVLVDYALGCTEITDDEIEQCILEADAVIAQIIDPAYQDSADAALQTAAACLALSFLCRNWAGLSLGTESSRASSSAWLDLAASYHETAMRLLNMFRRRVPGLKPPTPA